MSATLARTIAAVGIVAALGYTHLSAYNHGKDTARAQAVKLEHTRATAAQTKERNLQNEVDQAQKNYTQAIRDMAGLNRTIRDLDVRMRDTPTLDDFAQATLAAVSRYATDTDRDFAACRAEYAELGNTAAGASAAAHALHESWPQ